MCNSGLAAPWLPSWNEGEHFRSSLPKHASGIMCLQFFESELDQAFKKKVKKIINSPKRNKEILKHWFNKILKCWWHFKYLNYKDLSCAWMFIAELRWKIRSLLTYCDLKERKSPNWTAPGEGTKGTSKWNDRKNKYILRPQENPLKDAFGSKQSEQPEPCREQLSGFQHIKGKGAMSCV